MVVDELHKAEDELLETIQKRNRRESFAKKRYEIEVMQEHFTPRSGGKVARMLLRNFSGRTTKFLRKTEEHWKRKRKDR